ncbi:MAG: helix-turn-helix domain-containing protein, partial [Desulfuromonadales bacterium]
RTVTTWQKKRFRDYWRALSQSNKPGRPRISPELRKLIRRMWEANPTWGSPKIVAELAMLGINVAKSLIIFLGIISYLYGVAIILRMNRKRLANCIYPGPAGVVMMSSPSTDIPRAHHEFKLIQKRSQPPALV